MIVFVILIFCGYFSHCKSVELYVTTDGSGKGCVSTSPCSIIEAFKYISGLIEDESVIMFLKPGIYDVSSQESSFKVDPVVETLIIRRYDGEKVKNEKKLRHLMEEIVEEEESNEEIIIQSTNRRTNPLIFVDLSSRIHKHRIDFQFQDLTFLMDGPFFGDSLDTSSIESMNSDTLGSISFVDCQWKSYDCSVFSKPSSFQSISFNRISCIGTTKSMVIEISGHSKMNITDFKFISNSHPFIISSSKDSIDLTMNNVIFDSNVLTSQISSLFTISTSQKNEKANLIAHLSDFTFTNNVFSSTYPIITVTTFGSELYIKLSDINFLDTKLSSSSPLKVMSQGGDVYLENIQFPQTIERRNYSVYDIVGANFNLKNHMFKGLMGIKTTSSLHLTDSYFHDFAKLEIITNSEYSMNLIDEPVIIYLKNVSFQSLLNPILILSENSLNLTIDNCYFWQIDTQRELGLNYFLNISSDDDFSIVFRNLSFYNNKGSINILTNDFSTSNNNILSNVIDMDEICVISFLHDMTTYKKDLFSYFNIMSKTNRDMYIQIRNFFYSVVDFDKSPFRFDFSSDMKVSLDLDSSQFIATDSSSSFDDKSFEYESNPFLSVQYFGNEESSGIFLCSLTNLNIVSFVLPEFNIPSINLDMSFLEISQNDLREPFRITTTSINKSSLSIICINSISMSDIDGLIITSSNSFTNVELSDLQFVSTEHVVQIIALEGDLSVKFSNVSFSGNVNGMTMSTVKGLSVQFYSCQFFQNEKLFQLISGQDSLLEVTIESVDFVQNSNGILINSIPNNEKEIFLLSPLSSVLYNHDKSSDIKKSIKIDNCRFHSNSIYLPYVRSLVEIRASYLSLFSMSGCHVSNNIVNSDSSSVIGINAVPECSDGCEISSNIWESNTAQEVSGIEWNSITSELDFTLSDFETSYIFVSDQIITSCGSTTSHFLFSGHIGYIFDNMNFTNSEGTSSMISISGTCSVTLSRIMISSSNAHKPLIEISDVFSSNSSVILEEIVINDNFVLESPLVFLTNIQGSVVISGIVLNGNGVVETAIEIKESNIVTIDNYLPIYNELQTLPVELQSSLLRIQAENIVMSNMRMSSRTNKNAPACFEVVGPSQTIDITDSDFSSCRISLTLNSVEGSISFDSVTMNGLNDGNHIVPGVTFIDLPDCDISFSDVSIIGGDGIYMSNVGSFDGSGILLIENNGNLNRRDGGGLYFSFGNKTEYIRISKSSFISNRASRFGGGVFITYSTTFSSLMDLRNKNKDGEEIIIDFCSEEFLWGCNVTENEGAMFGGGVYIWAPDYHSVISNATYISNSAGIRGGGIFLQTTSLDGKSKWERAIGRNIVQNSNYAPIDPQKSFLPSSFKIEGGKRNFSCYAVFPSSLEYFKCRVEGIELYDVTGRISVFSEYPVLIMIQACYNNSIYCFDGILLGQAEGGLAEVEIEVGGQDGEYFAIGDDVLFSLALVDGENVIERTTEIFDFHFFSYQPPPPPHHRTHHLSNLTEKWIVFTVMMILVLCCLFCLFTVGCCCMICLLSYCCYFRRILSTNSNGEFLNSSYYQKKINLEDSDEEEIGEYDVLYESWLKRQQSFSSSIDFSNPSSLDSISNLYTFDDHQLDVVRLDGNNDQPRKSSVVDEHTPVLSYPPKTPNMPSNEYSESVFAREYHKSRRNMSFSSSSYNNISDDEVSSISSISSINNPFTYLETRDDKYEDSVLNRIVHPVTFRNLGVFEDYHWVTAPLQLILCNVGLMKSLSKLTSKSECARLLYRIRLSSSNEVIDPFNGTKDEEDEDIVKLDVSSDESMDDEEEEEDGEEVNELSIISFVKYCLQYDLLHVDIINPIGFLSSIFERLREEGCGKSLDRHIRWTTRETFCCVRCNHSKSRNVHGEILKINRWKFRSVQEYFTNYFGSVTSVPKGSYCDTCRAVMRYATFKCELSESKRLPRYAMVGIDHLGDEGDSLGSSYSSTSSLTSEVSMESLDDVVYSSSLRQKKKKKGRRKKRFKVDEKLRIGFGAVYSLWGILIERYVNLNIDLSKISSDDDIEGKEKSQKKKQFDPLLMECMIKKGVCWFKTSELSEILKKKMFTSRRELVEIASKRPKRELERIWMVYDSQSLGARSEDILGEEKLRKYIYGGKEKCKCVFLVYKRMR